MPSLRIEELQELLKDRPEYFHKIFVETGTYRGDTIFPLSRDFDKLYTIEVKQEFYEGNVKKAETYGVRNISFFLGDSAEVLPEILKSIEGPAIFFLDGHYSHGNTGRGAKDTPLIEELEAIDRIHNESNLILIDDCVMFGKNETEDWSDVTEEKLLNCFGPSKVGSHFVKDNRYIIFLNKV